MKEGQRFVDDPIYAKAHFDPVRDAVAMALNPAHQPKPPVLLGHQRTELRWMRPMKDRDGKVVMDEAGKPILIPRDNPSAKQRAQALLWKFRRQ